MFPGGSGGKYVRAEPVIGEYGDYERAFYDPTITVVYPFRITVGPTAPTSPQINDVWIDTSA